MRLTRKALTVAALVTGAVAAPLTCSSPDGTGHLHVGVKQGPGISPENTSSAKAVASSSTNWMSRGTALVQICVIDATGLSMDYSMKPVVITGPGS
jgi:hypothetical protein